MAWAGQDPLAVGGAEGRGSEGVAGEFSGFDCSGEMIDSCYCTHIRIGNTGKSWEHFHASSLFTHELKWHDF